MAHCKSCRAEIEFFAGPRGKAIPVQKVTKVYVVLRKALLDGSEEKTLRPIDLSAHGGEFWISHFQTCPDAERYSR